MASADTMAALIAKTGNKSGTKKKYSFVSPSMATAPTATVARLYPPKTDAPVDYTQNDYNKTRDEAIQRALDAIKKQNQTQGTGISQTQKNLNAYTQMLADMLRGDKFAAGLDRIGAGVETNKQDLLGALSGIQESARTGVGTAMDELSKYLGTVQTNPYKDFVVAQSPAGTGAMTPEVQDLLKTQGLSGEPLSAYAQTVGQQNQAQADAFANIAKIMQATTEQANTGRLADVGAQRAASLQDIANQNAAYQFIINQQAQQELNKLLGQREDVRSKYIDTLLSAIAKGGNVKNLKGLF